MFLFRDKLISLRQLSLSDERFFFSCSQEDARVFSSIRNYGVLQPILVQKCGKKYVLVSGWKRVHLASKAGLETIAAKIIDAKVPAAEVFRLSIEAKVLGGELHFLEKALILQKAEAVFGLEKPQIIKEILPLLSLSAHLKVLENYLFVSFLTEDLKKRIIAQDISLETVLVFSKFTQKDSEVLIGLVMDLHLGLNKAKEMAEFIVEIAERDSRLVVQLLADMRNILSETETALSQKGILVREWLRAKRFPRQTARERQIQETIKQLKLGPNIELKYPSSFEGNRFSLSFNFKDKNSLQESFLALEKGMHNQEAWNEFFERFAL